MAPTFRSGDLAIVTRSTAYDVGDIAAYRSALLDTAVMHRIIDRDGDRYVFKGDNNSWHDSEQPTRDDLIGKLWLRIPHAGRALGALAASWPLAAAVVFIVGTGVGTRRLRTRRPGQPMKLSTNSPEPLAYRRAHNTRAMARGALAVFLASVGVAALAFTQPTDQATTTGVPYVQRGAFEYTTPTAPSAAYPDGVIDTGEPLFVRLGQALDLRFVHRVETDVSNALEGTITLRARVANGTGWQRTIDLASAVPLTDGAGTATATFDITSIRALVDQLEASTGVHSAAHTVDIIADVRLQGWVAGQRVDETFAPQLPFRLDDLQLRPAWADVQDIESADTLHPRENRSVRELVSTRRHLSILGFELSVTDLRRVAIAGVALSAIALMVASAWIRRRGRTEAGLIAARYGERIIPVAAAEKDAHRAVIDVTSMDHLARLAAQYDCLILHQADQISDSYLFQVDRTVYRYAARRDTVASGPRRRAGVTV